VRASSKDLSTRIVFCIGHMVICACGLHPNPAKVPNFQYWAWLCSLDQKFHSDDEKTRESRFSDLVQCPTAIIRPKSQNSNIRHDCILSIGNFMLMINNHFARFQLPGKLLKTNKMCSLFPWEHGISYLFLLKSWFHLPHIEYEGSIGLVTRKMKKNYCWFSRVRIFYDYDLWRYWLNLGHAYSLPLFVV
jgi:hypothetical protein